MIWTNISLLLEFTCNTIELADIIIIIDTKGSRDAPTLPSSSVAHFAALVMCPVYVSIEV